MAIIDPVGFLCGDRIGSCSDEAQFHWPRLVAASNSFGRIELSYEAIISTVYRSIKRPPSPDKLASLLAEYRDKFLLFIYTSDDGDTWGQWMLPDHMKSKYHNAAAKRSPEPPKDGLESYRREYVNSRKCKSNAFNDILKPLLNLPILEVNPEISQTTSLGIGIGTGVVVGEGIVNGKGNTNTLAQPEVEPPSQKTPLSAEEVYRHYPRKVGKGAALRAIDKAAHRLKGGELRESGPMPLREAYELLQRAVQAYARSPAGNAGEYTPHPATWFNQSRYLDDPETWQTHGNQTTKGSQYESKWDRVEREALASLAGEEAANDG